MTYRVDVMAPSGTYIGTKEILGMKVNGKITINSATTADIDVEAPDAGISVNCPSEGYHMDSSGHVTLDNINKAGDCVHDNLQKDGLKLQSVDYDANHDQITLVIKKAIIKITMVLSHQGVVSVDYFVDWEAYK